MLSCTDLTVRFDEKSPPILDGVKAAFMPSALNAVIGPSGCGKTTLVKAMLGILPSTGEVRFGNEPIKRSEDLTGRVGFAPQFSIASDHLTVEESLAYALALYVKDTPTRRERLESVIKIIGLDEHRDKRVKSLSGGQLRRLGLGLELLNDPPCLVCDEVTSGLDPRSEDQILELLQRLCREQGKMFINIIHNLGKLDYFDLITVVYRGDVIFQGGLSDLLTYFEIEDALHLYDRLNQQDLAYWQERWQQYCGEGFDFSEHFVEVSSPAVPSAMSQLTTLMKRRFSLFFRDYGYLFLTLAITLGFPCLVIIFALDGLPQIESLALDPGRSGMMERMQETVEYRMRAAQTASLVTGLVMFQVILLTLMGSNNGAREIASERLLYEKERLNGLRPFAYGLSKILFTSLLAVVQAVVMTLLVKYVCEFPGPLTAQGGVLILCCVSMTLVCLAFSAMMHSPEKASSLSIYLVGFQLPLSGVVLALPPFLVWICRPFINAYWSWAGYIGSMKQTRFYDALQDGDPLWVPEPSLAAMVLLAQLLVACGFVFWGCARKSWD